MSVTDNPVISTKRKIDDHDELCEFFFANSDFNFDELMNFSPVHKMFKHNQDQIPAVRYSVNSSSSSTVVNESSPMTTCRKSSELQFFVKMITEGKTIVMRAKRDDTVNSLRERVFGVTGIPVVEQRLLYGGKQLQFEQTLEECGVENDAGLQLVGRMRSTTYPLAWQLIGDMISVVMRLYKGERMLLPERLIQQHLSAYWSMIPLDGSFATKEYLDIFITASAPAALLILYMSDYDGNKRTAVKCVQHLLNTCIGGVAKHLHFLCVPVVLEFCKLLIGTGHKCSVYKACRFTLGVLLEGVVLWNGTKGLDGRVDAIGMSDVFPFINELKFDLCKDLMSSLDSSITSKPSAEDVLDFIAFLKPVKNMIKHQIGFMGPISFPLEKYPSFFVKEIVDLLWIYHNMMAKMNMCLHNMEYAIIAKGTEEALQLYSGWSQYLKIMKELHGIAKIYPGAEESFWKTMQLRRDSVCTLIIRYAERTDEHFWLLGHNDVTDFDSRRHLVMMMLPEVKDDYDELHEMLIDRSKLLEESFAYVAHAEPESLHSGLFIEFKNEEATGVGVLREWFLMVCQAIFNQPNALFLACRGDPRRFYPNPASKVDALHLEYFTFCGRVIALALMHKVQVGILFARCFFLQLAGKNVSLEDIQDADPIFCSSCKKILEMNADFIDSDALGLTFVYEVEVLGSRKVVELCPGGKSIVVNSKNRSQYIELLIQNRFVKSVTEQVTYFAEGFNDMLCDKRFDGVFFEDLELEDLDRMLYGCEDTIGVEDWMAHTDYNGYKATDPEIVWFWEVVGEMSLEQKKNLLFFWTSVKHLPYNGFRGLASRLQINRVVGACNRLPSSQTCFHRLCVPPYPTMAVMRARLNIIAQDHVGASFGNW